MESHLVAVMTAVAIVGLFIAAIQITRHKAASYHEKMKPFRPGEEERRNAWYGLSTWFSFDEHLLFDPDPKVVEATHEEAIVEIEQLAKRIGAIAIQQELEGAKFSQRESLRSAKGNWAGARKNLLLVCPNLARRIPHWSAVEPYASHAAARKARST